MDRVQLPSAFRAGLHSGLTNRRLRSASFEIRRTTLLQSPKFPESTRHRHPLTRFSSVSKHAATLMLATAEHAASWIPMFEEFLHRPDEGVHELAEHAAG